MATVGEAPCFFLNGASYLAVLWALAGMRLADRRPAVARHGGRDVRSGLRYVRRRPVQAALLLALGLVSALGLSANVLMPSLAQRTFARGRDRLRVAADRVRDRRRAVRAAPRVEAVHPCRAPADAARGARALRRGLCSGSPQPRFPIAIACQFLAGLGMIRFTATTNTLIQLLVDDDYRGRVMGLHTVMFLGMAPFGSLLLGAIAEPFGARAALVVSGCAPLLALAFLVRRLGLPEPAPALHPWRVGDGACRVPRPDGASRRARRACRGRSLEPSRAPSGRAARVRGVYDDERYRRARTTPAPASASGC